MVVGKEGVSVVVRFPRELLERLTAAARRNGRSRNTEIVMRLTRSVGERKRTK